MAKSSAIAMPIGFWELIEEEADRLIERDSGPHEWKERPFEFEHRRLFAQNTWLRIRMIAVNAEIASQTMRNHRKPTSLLKKLLLVTSSWSIVAVGPG